jgi:hypothetical protein
MPNSAEKATPNNSESDSPVKTVVHRNVFWNGRRFCTVAVLYWGWRYPLTLSEFIKAVAAVVLILGSALPFGYLGKPTEMGLGLVVGAIAAAFINIDKIQELKGAGFQLKMRQVIEEAYATTKALRKLAKPLLESTVYMLTMAGRAGGLDEKQKHTFRAEFERLGSELQLGDDIDIRAVHEAFFRYHTWDHFNAFVHNLEAEDNKKILAAMGRDYGSTRFPSQLEIEQALEPDIPRTRLSLEPDINKLNPADKDRLKIYLHYREHHTLP